MGAAPILGGLGLAMMGGGQLASAFGSPGGAAQIDPAVQAALEQQGIDVNRLQAEMQAGLANYGIGQSEAMQQAYNQRYGAGENAAAEFAQAILGGGGNSPFVTNALANMGIGTAQQRTSAINALNQDLAQRGIDPSSPYAQGQRQKLEEQLRMQENQLRANFVQQQLPFAMDVMKTGMTSNRLAGADQFTPKGQAQSAYDQLLAQKPGANASMAEKRAYGFKVQQAKSALDEASNPVPKKATSPREYLIPDYQLQGERKKKQELLDNRYSDTIARFENRSPAGSNPLARKV